MTNNLLTAYNIIFGKTNNLKKIFSPYRICPLGAHVDHQGGIVSGFTFDRGIEFLFSATDNGWVEMCSLSFEGLTSFSVVTAIQEKQNNWGDYLRGATLSLRKKYNLSKGVRGVLCGSMPIGGLSSSAALLVGFVKALASVNNLDLSDEEIICVTSEAEREYVGLKNGILDQACVTLCKKGKLLFLDTMNRAYENLNFGESDKNLENIFEVAIFFSGVTRNLVGTDYNLRVSECKTAAWMIQAYEDIPLKPLTETKLGYIDERLYKKNEKRIPCRFNKRVKHFYTECDRVRKGIEAWKAGNVKDFGKLMFESCESSVENYECGSPELISLYEIMMETDGVYGGRFSGAGFKGACIALTDPSKRERIRERIRYEYLKRFPQHAKSYSSYFCNMSDGVKFV